MNANIAGDSDPKTDPWASFGYSRSVRGTKKLLLLAGLLGALPFASPALADDESLLLRGPHPFLKENALIVAGGFAAATGGTVGGLKLKGAFEYELLGSLWLNLQLGFVDGTDKPIDGRACRTCGRAADAMAGLTYRLRMDIPIILSGTLAAGFLFVFPDTTASAMGLGARPSVAARYFLFDWLGLGLELGGLLGFASHDSSSGLSRGLAALEALLAIEIQFDTP